MFFGISKKIRRKTRKNFSDLLKNHCDMGEDSIDDLADMIDREDAIYYGLAKFEKVEKDGKEFYACDLLGRDLFGKEYLFERQDDCLVWQRGGTCEGSYYGYIAHERKDGQWVVFKTDYSV
nr:MAG TPA: hypothetical protein [Caudoviricetes sp.]